MRTLAIALTGASGIVYGTTLVDYLLENTNIVLWVSFSKKASEISLIENGIDLTTYFSSLCKAYEGRLHVFREDDFNSPLASSSSAPDSMVVVPCSMKTLGELASGIATNVITRAALNVLRLRRKLVVVPRETPLGPVELSNMLKLAVSGAIILPAMPAFYHKPKTVEDLVNFIVGKILDVLNLSHSLYRRWTEV